MKTVLSHILGLLLLWSSAVCAHDVVVVQSLPVKPYDEAARGLRSACKGEVKQIVLSELQGEDVLRVIQESSPRLIVAVGAEALAKVKKIRQTPIEYLMVLTPPASVQAQPNVTGVSMTIPPERYLAILEKALPAARRIGLVYDPTKSGTFVRRAQQTARSMGFELIAREARTPREVPNLLQGMKGAIDAFWMIPDTTVVTPESVEFLLLFAQESRLPVMTFAAKYVEMGALFSLDLDPFDLGKQAAEMANRMLAGEAAADIPRSDARKGVTRFNRSVAKRLGVNPDEAERSGPSERK